MMFMRRVAGLVGAVVVVLAACGGGSSKPYNSTDVTFAQGMIPHHEQAIEMATMATAQAEGGEVKALAARILKAQAPEIQQMTGWLQSWGQPLTATVGGADMDHDGGDMGGMMSANEMEQLEVASGSAFDTTFLTMMVTHHQGAVTMAQTEAEKGKFAEAKQLAQTIIRAQQAEIMEMQQLLAGG
jgi:uncharacterized protein (DUF305 family)